MDAAPSWVGDGGAAGCGGSMVGSEPASENSSESDGSPQKTGGYLSLRGRFGLLRNDSCCSRLHTRNAK